MSDDGMNWGVVMTAPLPFLAALASGVFISWVVVRLIYNTRITHHQDVINNLRAVLEEKLPASSYDDPIDKDVVAAMQKEANKKLDLQEWTMIERIGDHPR